ncbi:FAD-dependent oxidoreductase [Desulfitobacterium hafniense]|uniref:Fumarate reductase n=4 Tax=root TaxID=1 RepID=A0A098B415_DESHA|nr:FAD-dependent oxidoreductase [Desulfitobacterium hafniense]EHL05952.1 Tat pathway signal sequence domain protein [Desulfitobacterium hafniense DP7]KTE91743.1 fumarate reductase [Desulfitobacterium hafniense]MEA5022895.1 FAD-dependent oxidoreductase [Desulfitobacterium hafniense]CDX03618.1 Tat pathway signal sequence [Desulfitobacterium hafniense]BAE82691.1 putative fumarate reductase flavoprotein subunit [Desulfitobacterium hafniense Y51]
MSNEISRRGFLKGAAGAVGAIAVTGLAGCAPQTPAAAKPETEQPSAGAAAADDWLGPEPATGSIAETQTFDVVIVGAGLAGICAARAAAEEGARVAIIEKSESFNCRSGEYALLNGTLNKRWGRENIVPTDVVVDRLMKECTYRNKRTILKKWAEHAHEVMDWFIEAYPDLTICTTTRQAVTQEQFDKGILVPLSWPLPEGYNYAEEDFPTFPSSMEFRSSRRDQQGFVVEANLNAALAKGAKIFYGCFGTKLLKDDRGRVTGIIVRDAKNSKYLQFNADRGVVLATGDNAGDEKILRHFAPEVIEKGVGNMGAMGMLGKDVEGNPVDTGDGLRMGAWLGAKVQDYHAPMTHHMGSGMGVTPFLQLNKHGERFMNEDIPGQQLHNQIELQPELTSFQIFDSDWGKQIPFMAPAHGGLCYIIPEDEDESNPNFADRQYTKLSAKKADSFAAQGNTIPELLRNLGFAGEGLERALASVQRYNELAKAGRDEDFGKSAKRMFPIEKAPFYATKWGTAAMLVCIGGLESDEDCRTFTAVDAKNPERQVIPGLYVCGNVMGNRFAVEYPICMRGISHSLCVYYGYAAGKNCAQGV